MSHQTLRAPRRFAALLLAAAPLAALPLAPQEPAPEGRDPLAATGRGHSVRTSELDRVLLERYGMTQRGREILKLLVSTRLIDRIAGERGMEVSEKEIQARWREIDRQARASGQAGGLQAELASRGLKSEELREFLRLSILHERLTREALGLRDDAPVSGGQQEVWLDQELETRGFELRPPPFSAPADVVATCDGIAVDAARFGRALRERLDRDDVRMACWHLLLLAGIEARMPDLGREGRERALQGEIERRRAKQEAEVTVSGVGFEELLRAQGRTLESLRRDPSVGIAALSRLWVDRTLGTDGLRATYERERALFEGRFGQAVHAHMLFLIAGRFVNDLVPRTFEEAEDELERLVRRVDDLAGFRALCARHSEEPRSRQESGDLGFVTRTDPRLPSELCAEVFRFLESGGRIPPEGRRLGPVRLPSGAALLWLSEVRPSPPWEEMAEHVHAELRRRFLEDVLPEEEVELRLIP
jgi:hypothetical protein